VGGQCHDSANITQGMTYDLLCIRLGGSKGRPGCVRKFSPNPGFDHRTFQRIANFCLLLMKRRTPHDHILRERKWHSHGILSFRGTVCDFDPYLMVKIFSLILSVRTRRMEWFDVCTFCRKRRTTWN